MNKYIKYIHIMNEYMSYLYEYIHIINKYMQCILLLYMYIQEHIHTFRSECMHIMSDMCNTNMNTYINTYMNAYIQYIYSNIYIQCIHIAFQTYYTYSNAYTH